VSRDETRLETLQLCWSDGLSLLSGELVATTVTAVSLRRSIDLPRYIEVVKQTHSIGLYVTGSETEHLSKTTSRYAMHK